MTNNCMNCGNELNDGAKFCAKCGAKVETQSTPQFAQPVQQQIQMPLQQPQPTALPAEPNSKPKKTWLWIMLVFLLLAGLAVAAILYFRPFDRNNKDLWQVNVPNVINSSYDDALSTLRNDSLHGLIYDKIENEGTTDSVISQSPEAKELVSRGSIVDLTLSEGKKMAFLPNVENFNFEEAEKLIKDAGFTVRKEEETDENVAPNAVKSQSVPSGYTEKGQEVVIKVAPKKNVGTETVTVPDIVGKDFDTAKAELNGIGLYLSINVAQYSGNINENVVMKQDKTAGVQAKKGETVLVTVSLGEEKVYVPDLTFRTEKKAKDMLTSLGLTVIVKPEKSKTVAKGTVISQETGAGTGVKKGSQITITVSDGYQVTVPDVKGMKEEKAIKKLLDAELAVNVVYKKDSSVKKGEVISQDVRKGEKLQLGDVVTICVSADKDSGEEVGGKNVIETGGKNGGQQEKQIKIKYAASMNGCYEFGKTIISCSDVSYYICGGNLCSYSQSGEVILSDENCNDFIIVNDIIYYTTTDDEADHSNIEMGMTLADYATSSVRKMNLDGSGKEQLFSFSGKGCPVFADDENIYYANMDVFEAYDDSNEYSFHRYNLKEKKDYPILSEQKYHEFTYVNGIIFFREHSYVGAVDGAPAWKFDISSQQLTALNHNVRYISRMKDDKVLMVEYILNNQLNQFSTKLYIYDTADGSCDSKTVFEDCVYPYSDNCGNIVFKKQETVNGMAEHRYYTVDKDFNITEVGCLTEDELYAIFESVVDGGIMYVEYDGLNQSGTKKVCYYDFATDTTTVVYTYNDESYPAEMNKNVGVFYKYTNPDYKSEYFSVIFPAF